MSIHVAIVEDDDTSTKTLSEYLLRYAEENHIQFRISAFDSAVSMLDNYTADYDIIFMDIRMPYMNGMDAAHRLRALDQKVILIFVTSLTQYAIEGYEVNAQSYIVKPAKYYDFAMKLSRAVNQVPAVNSAKFEIHTRAGTIRLDPNEIQYIESHGHRLTFHTFSGEYTQLSSLNKLEEQLSAFHFARCNSCYLVNLQYVSGIKGYTVFLKNCELKISQPRKKAFLQAFEQFLVEFQTPPIDPR